MTILVCTIINIILLSFFGLVIYFAWRNADEKRRVEFDKRARAANRRIAKLTLRCQTMQTRFDEIAASVSTKSDKPDDGKTNLTRNVFNNMENRVSNEMNQVVSVNGNPVKAEK